jgi:type VI secretion system secreted protein VgrG
MAQSSKRFFNGICNRISRGEKTEEFVNYHLELVPQFWLLTRVSQSRIFQQLTVPDILKKVLTGLDVSWELQGEYKSREYCVQYQESDFNFASRLMEEEGMYYFFKHSDGGHQMVVADTPQSHPDIPYESTVKFEEFFGHSPEEVRVYDWSKGQELRSGKVTLWEEHFQLPNQHLDAEKTIQDSVSVGKETHKLTAGGAAQLELYDFPGEYSRHFDGINKSGGEQPSHLQWIFSENVRIAGVRMQQEAVNALLIEAKASHAGFTSGHAFTLKDHFSDDARYILTSVEHTAQQPLGAQQDEHGWKYVNEFTCIPAALPYRPQRTTPVPSVRGVQLATVVGPPGEEIFPDRYSRVKVQFHWDRQGKNDIDSSCWIRVGTFWAGKQWGAIHIPRIGQEVIVAFEEGDVNHPIIVGSVYNADMMPPYKLPDNKTQSGIKSRSSKGGSPDNYNEIRFEDKKGSEEILVHAELDLRTEVERDEFREVGRDRNTKIKRDDMTKIDRMGVTEAIKSFEIKVGQSSILLEPAQITIKSPTITIESQIATKMKSAMTTIESSGITTIKGSLVKIN